MACIFEAHKRRVRCPHQRRCYTDLPCNFDYNPDKVYEFWEQLVEDLSNTIKTCDDLRQLVDYISSPDDNGQHKSGDEQRAYEVHIEIELSWTAKLNARLQQAHERYTEHLWYAREQKRELDSVEQRARERLDGARDTVEQLQADLVKVSARLGVVSEELEISQTRSCSLAHESGALNKQVAAVLPETSAVAYNLNQAQRETVTLGDIIERLEQQQDLLKAAIKDEGKDLHDHKARLAKCNGELDEVRDQCQQRARQIMDVHAQSDFVEQEKSVLQNRAEAVQCDIDTAFVAFTQKVTTSGDHQAALREAADRLAQMYNELKEKSELLRWSRRELRDHESRAEAVRVRLEAAVQDSDTATAQIGEMRQALDGFTTAAEELRAENEFVDDELRKAQLLHIRAVEDHQELEQYADELRATRMAHLEQAYFNSALNIATEKSCTVRTN